MRHVKCNRWNWGLKIKNAIHSIVVLYNSGPQIGLDIIEAESRDLRRESCSILIIIPEALSYTNIDNYR